jgi:uncharacterized LabA/DUF88 family protein
MLKRESKKIKAERVYVFIDGGNLYKSMKIHINWTSINIQKFSEYLCGENRRLVKICYYNAPVNQNENPLVYKEQQRFFSALRKTSYLELRLGNLRKREKEYLCSKCNEKTTITYFVEKGVDVRLAVDLLQYAFDDQYDTAILVTQDGDFVPAVQEVQRLHKKIENAHFEKSHLSSVCDKFVLITDAILNPYKLKKND